MKNFDFGYKTELKYIKREETECKIYKLNKEELKKYLEELEYKEIKRGR